MTLMILGLTTVEADICGGDPVTAMELTKDETVKRKPPEIVKRNVERGVGQATPIVMSKRRVEVVVPGRLLVWGLIETRLMRLLFLN